MQIVPGCIPKKVFPSFGPTHMWCGRGQCVLKISCATTTMTVIVMVHKDGATRNRPPSHKVWVILTKWHFSNIRTTELKLCLYEIFLCKSVSSAFQKKYFRHWAQLIGDVERGSAFWKFHAPPPRWLSLSWSINMEPQGRTIGLEKKRTIAFGKYWDTKTMKIAEKRV